MQKKMILTGGTRGIGYAVLEKAANKGYSVFFSYLKSTAKADEIEKRFNRARKTVRGFCADVSKTEDVRDFFRAADEFFGRPNALVNNAGILETQMEFSRQNRERWERVINTNLIGTMECCREAILRMSTDYGGKGGSIVNLSSVAAQLGSPFEYVDYAASKGAVDSLTTGLSKELATKGIRVNSVRPGIINTKIHASGGMPDRPAKLAGIIPMKRPGSADEVANTILWLLSDEASYVTGAKVSVTGGR